MDPDGSPLSLVVISRPSGLYIVTICYVYLLASMHGMPGLMPGILCQDNLLIMHGMRGV